ncbi:MAG: helix-turn-helix transcriptional regulator [Gemmatimonadota bacterium]|nr:helix-turn-helix transcriptional regulator [Gemmatimonadota bacterium]
MGASGEAAPVETRGARATILASARREILVAGWQAATSGRVAEGVGVSKALVHYHFRDKHALLLALALGAQEAIRERSAKAPRAMEREHPVDAFSEWVESELVAEDVRLALQLRHTSSAATNRAADGALADFRRAMTRQVAAVFDSLGVSPRVSIALVSELFGTMAVGLASEPGRAPHESRRALETLWLAVLSMAD